MGDGPRLHLLKLCVGADGVDDLVRWQATFAARMRAAGRATTLRHVTRQWPKRADDLLAGGSLYWVFRGVVMARQRIQALEPEDGEDGVRRCAILLDPAIVRTTPQPRRPFQGWRYLQPGDAPADLGEAASGEALPAEMAAALDALGVGPRRS